MTPTIEVDGREVTVEDFIKAPPIWVLGRIFGGSSLGRSRVYTDLLNSVPPDRAIRSKVQHYGDEIYFQL